MERLTYRDARGEAWYSADGTGRDFLHRLTEYEDTGLTPEEIKSALLELKEQKELWNVLPLHIQFKAREVRDYMKVQELFAEDTNVPTKKEV